MRTVIPQQRRSGRLIAQIAGASMLLGTLALISARGLSAQPVAPPRTIGKTDQRTAHPASLRTSAQQPKQAPAAATPASPKPPDWPANDQPTKATVVWNSHGLSIDAKNSSLRQILDDVAAATGSKVEGLGTDERIFGEYGPGQPRDVLSQLLHGSDYNVLMIGGQGVEPPKQIVLSARPKGGVPPPTPNTQASSNEEDVPYENQPSQPPIPINPGFNPANGPRTPQEIMREMMQRQQQMRQHENQPQ